MAALGSVGINSLKGWVGPSKREVGSPKLDMRKARENKEVAQGVVPSLMSPTRVLIFPHQLFPIVFYGAGGLVRLYM